MLWEMINASSKPGDVVADFFMGSGSTMKMAIAAGRRGIGIEMETARFNQTVDEIKEITMKQ
ncbi:C-terminal part of DNA methylase [Shimwellia blattae DSM 4481 = NBRC 105725]|uniref:C-terminal part of DNA methylase n=2 Tax=Shimwellia blattae TaxID=563 RepID=I2B9F9_SHIBC|nr:C-terminal part of DNA methylase [Shimwellia blattae DSM 4481 = NBRC 105725]